MVAPSSCPMCSHFRCKNCRSWDGPTASSISQHLPYQISNHPGHGVRHASAHSSPSGSARPNSKPKSDEETSSSSGDDDAWNDALLQDDMAQLPSGIDPDPRLMNPSKYFGELNNLEKEVFLHSAFGMLGPDGLGVNLDGPFDPAIRFPQPKGAPKSKIDDTEALGRSRELLARLPDPIFDEMDPPQKAVVEGVMNSVKSFLNMVECRNILCAVEENISRMYQAGYYTHCISMLALESDRNVARLARLYTPDIIRIRTLFDNAVSARFSRIRSVSYDVSRGSRFFFQFLPPSGKW